jgi:hypothetical protein
MTDQLARDLADLFQSTADGADTPHLALDDVVARGRALREVRRRRAALWTAVAAAAAVVAVCLPVALVGQGGHHRPVPAHRTSAPSPSIPASQPPILAYLDHGTLHAGGLTMPTGGNRILSRGGTTYVTTSKKDPWSWSHLVDGRLKPVGPSHSDAQPWTGWQAMELSPDGSLLAVVTNPTQNSTRVTAYRTTDDTEIDHVDLALPFSNWTGGGNSLSLLGVDGQDRIYWAQEPADFAGPETDWVWHPSSGAPAQLGEPFASQPYGMFTVTPAGPLVDHEILGEADDGTWHDVTRFADPGNDDSSGTVWSPSGAVYARGPDAPALISTATGAEVEPRLPARLHSWIGFESDTDVLGVVGTSQEAELVRCNVSTGGCAAVEKLPAGWRSWQWATNGPAASAAAPTGNPTAGVPTSAPLVPYVRDGVLHLDGRSIGNDLTRAVASGGTVLALRLTELGAKANGANTTTVSLVEGGRLVPIPALTSIGLSNHESSYAPYLSPDGAVAVAMSWRHQTTLRMTAWSVSQHRVLGTIDLRDTMIAPEDIAGIERDGTVIYFDSDAQHGYAWLPGHAPRRLDATTSAAIKQGSVVVGDSGISVLKGVSLLAGLSPGGSAALTLDNDGTASVLDLHTGRAVALHLPQHVYDPIGFESAKAVLVSAGDEDGGPLFRCDTTSGACAQIWSDTRGIAFPRLRGGW